MDRFIVPEDAITLYVDKCLKSNMDRFIVYESQEI